MIDVECVKNAYGHGYEVWVQVLGQPEVCVASNLTKEEAEQLKEKILSIS